MKDLFTECIFGNSGYARKPDPEMFTTLIKKYQLDHREVLAIGDRDIDIQAGRSAGVSTCLFTNGEEKVNKTTFKAPDYVTIYNALKSNDLALFS